MSAVSVASLTSSNSDVSGSSDYSVDGYSNYRDSQEEGSSGSGQDESNRCSVDSLRDTRLPSHRNGLLPSNMTAQDSRDRGISLNDARTGNDADFMQTGSNLLIYEERENTLSHKGEMDLQFWLPPEAEDQEHDMECSVANYDDDDDDVGEDGTKWGQPTSLSSFGEQTSGSFRYKEERQKAMDGAMNYKFKALVGHLLKSSGVAFSDKDKDNWVDIVTSLSWEAASFLKPVINDGNAMDPVGYLKVKCVATGRRSESQLVKGMVFKRHAAHKHMPASYKKPRLLLIEGALDLSLSGLSSFESMKQEKDISKSIMERIEMCNPDVILVEKNVSRDIQESILEKGMTLIIEMKLHRLHRVARCTGSSIFSSNKLTGKKLRQCDSFHFEKFVEEHSTGESGKKPTNTLMFIEGCPTHRGCTILLKGANSEELKKIKLVVQYLVLVAYHLILETAFLLDQKAMFSTLPLDVLLNVPVTNQVPSQFAGKTNASCSEDSTIESDASRIVDIQIAYGCHEGSRNLGPEGDTLLPFEPYSPLIFSGFSSIPRAFGHSIPRFSSKQSTSTYFGFNGEVPNSKLLNNPEVNAHSDLVAEDNCGEEKAHYNDGTSAKGEAQLGTKYTFGDYKDQAQFKEGSSAVPNDDSILVLMSRRNFSTGTICDQSHFSHIKFYRNFDVPLGIFLLDNILNQRLLCNLCGGSTEAHVYYYAHYNKQLTIQVRRLEKYLPGETDGKIWMWSRCGNCKPQSGKRQSTKRVLISAAARGLSFGKFLELSLSNHFSSSRFSICGHQLHTDVLYFFGLGPMIAMLRYSPITTYSVSLPPEKLQFARQIRGERLKKDFDNISNLYEKGIAIFIEVEKSLKEISSRLIGPKLNIRGSLREFSDIDEMLKEERKQFEDGVQNTLKDWYSGDSVDKVVGLNRVQWDIFLASCVWDRRLHALLSYEITSSTTTSHKLREEQSNLKEDSTAGEEPESAMECEEVSDISIGPNKYAEPFSEKNCIIKVQIEGDAQGLTHQYNLLTTSTGINDTQNSCMGISNANGSSNQDIVSPHISVDSNAEYTSAYNSAHPQKIVSAAKDLIGDANDSNPSQWKSSVLLISGPENSEWIWSPFPEIRNEYMKDLQKGYSLIFEPTNSCVQGSRLHDVINDEGSRLRIPLGMNNYIVSDREDELSSIVACALALLKNPSVLVEDSSKDTIGERGTDAKSYERSRSVTRPSSLSSSSWSSFGSLTSDGIYSSSSTSSDDSGLLVTNGFYLSDSLVYCEDIHPEVSMGLRKLPGRGKYSVVSLYASEFQDLRRRCCPSELDYIVSLSRCKDWDAKGGKSKSFFAKTLDDRFIIKEIKRTEYESFLEFAPDYFKYMKDCFEQGNQTCLAKILGIHQVIVRHKSGRETKHDLMVMENLTFERSVSRQYDLKGALHSRLNSAPDGSGDVLLDQNFVNDMNNSPFYVGRQAKRHLQRAVWNDTTFLNSINVMDYSLLVGVDTQKGELVCGIIDYLRQYTWDKQLENWVKSSLVVPKNQLPTVVSPKEYKKRFRKFMTTYFVSVPDHWCSQTL